MPCIKCSNGKWKYGEHGRCQFDTLAACKAAEAGIHARQNVKKNLETQCDCNCDCKSNLHNCPNKEICQKRRN